MHKLYSLLILGILCSQGSLFAQETLPDFTLKNTNGKINILWLNKYPGQVNGISIQRSSDSIKNFTSIVSINNPQNSINGYTDIKPPNDKMFYRLFIGFNTGVYVITGSKKPEISKGVDYTRLIQEINTMYEKNMQLQQEKLKSQKETESNLEEKAASRTAKEASKAPSKRKPNMTPAVVKPPVDTVDTAIITEVISYPSKRIYTDKDNNLIINLPDLKSNKYVIKFFTEDYKPLFEINNVPEDYFIIEKVNFKHSGWFLFEIYNNEVLLEENKFYIPKE